MDVLEILIILAVFYIIDIVYLKIVSGSYNRAIKKIQGSPLRIKGGFAFITYLIMTFALYYFIISKGGNYLDAVVLGVSLYGIFNFTNMAILKDWPISLAITDTIWGGVLFLLTIIVYQKLTPKKYILSIINGK